MNVKKTLVLGASEKTHRYSNRALRMLKEHGHEVIAVGNRKGNVEDTKIQLDFPLNTDVDTVTLYLNSQRQSNYEEAILELLPKRVIFNPGAENQIFMQKLEEKGIETLEACTLVMLSIGNY